MNPHLPPELLPLLAERLGWTLLHSLWQGALIAAVLAVALPFFRTATARHAACLLALLGLVSAIAVTFARHRPSLSAFDPPAPMPASVETQFVASSPNASSSSTPRTAPLAPSPTPSSWRERLAPSVLLAAGHDLWASSWQAHLRATLPWVSAVWLVGVALLTLRHGFGWQRIHAMRRTGVAARPELQRTFARLLEKFGCTVSTLLLESAHVAVPMLAGLVKPAVLLPLRVVTGLRPCEIEAILAHELAHLVRQDAWSNLAQVAIETLLFYHPAVWWIGRHARQERENAADDLVLAVCADRRVYANALAQLAELECASRSALAATGGSVLARIQRIVQPAPVETPGGAWSLCLVPLLAALALALTTIFPAEAQTPKPEAETPKQATEKSEALLKPWLADAFQLDDVAKREAAIERIRTALRSADADEARAGITAFGRIASIAFDKPSFRPEVRALLGSADAPTRAGAANAVAIIGGEPEDVERILALADDPAEEVRAVLTSVIVRLKKNDLRDKGASDAILKLMANLPRDSRSVAHSVWGSQLSPEIEARVLEFTRDMDRASNGDVGYNFFYGALSTQANKSEASCRRLIELLAHEDITNIAGRAAWGLHQGVDAAQYSLVADAMIKVIEARSEGNLRDRALSFVRTFGTAEQIDPLIALLAKPGVSGPFRDELRNVLSTLYARRSSIGGKVATPRISDLSQLPSIPQNQQALREESRRIEIANLKKTLDEPALNPTQRQAKERSLALLEAETPTSAATEKSSTSSGPRKDNAEAVRFLQDEVRRLRAKLADPKLDRREREAYEQMIANVEGRVRELETLGQLESALKEPAKSTRRTFTILGHVAKPGTFAAPSDRPIALLEAIGMAGGFTERADRDKILVRRTPEKGAETTLKLSAKQLSERGAESFHIHSGDVITVGATWQ